MNHIFKSKTFFFPFIRHTSNFGHILNETSLNLFTLWNSQKQRYTPHKALKFHNL